MPIRWDPSPVREALDAAEAALKEAEPALLRAVATIQSAVADPDLPGYMVESLKNLPRHIQDFYKSSRQDLRLARDRIPDSPVARTKTRSAPSLF